MARIASIFSPSMFLLLFWGQGIDWHCLICAPKPSFFSLKNPWNVLTVLIAKKLKSSKMLKSWRNLRSPPISMILSRMALILCKSVHWFMRYMLLMFANLNIKVMFVREGGWGGGVDEKRSNLLQMWCTPPNSTPLNRLALFSSSSDQPFKQYAHFFFWIQ